MNFTKLVKKMIDGEMHFVYNAIRIFEKNTEEKSADNGVLKRYHCLLFFVLFDSKLQKFGDREQTFRTLKRRKCYEA